MSIGIITISEIEKEDKYQKLILIIYNPPYKHEKYLCLRSSKETSYVIERRHPEEIKNQILLGYAEPP